MAEPTTTHRCDASAPHAWLPLDGEETPAPEPVLAFFAFLLHFAWELVQVPLFANMATAAHADATLVCFKATLGDVAMALVAYWGLRLGRVIAGGCSARRLQPGRSICRSGSC